MPTATSSPARGWHRSGPGPLIYVFSPRGAVIETHPFPADCPNQCCFGGDGLDTLYVTTGGGQLYRASDRSGVAELTATSARQSMTADTTMLRARARSRSRLAARGRPAHAQDYPDEVHSRHRRARAGYRGAPVRRQDHRACWASRSWSSRAPVPAERSRRRRSRRAAPDGYNLLLASASYTINTALQQSPLRLGQGFRSGRAGGHRAVRAGGAPSWRQRPSRS